MSEHQLEHPSENGLVEGGEEAGPIVSVSEQPGPIGAGEAEPTGAGEGELGGSEEWEIELVRADGKESEDLTGGSREVEPRAEFLLGENESNGGESERGSSVAWSEINFPGESKRERRNNSFGGTRRKKALVEDDWEDWPILGSGWKRKEVFRRSGASVGKTDTYYLSPDGTRMRSRIEMVKHIGGQLDLTQFDYKSGCFVVPGGTLKRKRGGGGGGWRKKEKLLMETDDFSQKLSSPDVVSTPDSVRTPDRVFTPDSARTPDRICTPVKTPQTKPSPPKRSPQRFSLPKASPIKFSTPPNISPHAPPPCFSSSSSSHPDPSSWSRAMQNEPHAPPFVPTEPIVLGCENCGKPLSGMEFGITGQLCSNCSPAMKPESPQNIVFRKWLPCGQCVACHVTVDCGMCASCRNGLLNPHSARPVRCQRRKCLRPIRKKKPLKAQKRVKQMKSVKVKKNLQSDYLGRENRMKSVQKVKLEESQRDLWQDEDYIVPYSKNEKEEQYSALSAGTMREFPIPQYLNPEDFSYFYVDNEDDNDDQDGPKKRSRRSCGGCEACLRTTDCRTCDFCQDKPKFGGRNKKRQKCRLRQCQVEAMRHLLPFQRGQTKHMGDVGWLGPGRQRPQSPRTPKLRRSKAGRPRKKTSPDWPSWGAFQFTNDDDEEEEEEYELQYEEELELEEDCMEEDIELDRRVPPELQGIPKFYQGDPSPQLPQYPGYPNHKPETQQLYMSGYPIAMQGCMKTDYGNVQIMKVNEFSRPGEELSDCFPSTEVQVLYDRTGAPVLFEKPPPPPPPPVVPQMLYSKATAPPFCREVQQQGEREAIETIDLEEEEEEEEGVKIVQVDTGDDDVLEVTPVITGIYSLASGESAQPQPHELLLFLDRIRQVPLPAHWVGLALEGPRIQLLQCSKLSTMSDTVVQIEPGFYYQITVQGQPLLLSHPLYERHPQRLLAVGDVIGLLADLEGYRVCPGYPSHLPGAEGEEEGEPVMFVRAAACDLLVRSEGRCDRCSVTPLVV
ncbi:uncharacterized protein LOC117404193 isoform X2 [Acipenser ruthenus]|uniref:uncharacterized protein LOC117404193 isoform X2 n=1 Tax=Acipenser ruthenus TaxID=7906 RepID=UPI0027411447|nr:uncharacterized protein LOC117404193 isoform X2 [Acipenser ruthenus]